MKLAQYKLGDICRMKYGRMPPKEVLSDDGFPVFSGYRITGFATEYLYDEPHVIVVARGVGGTGDVKLSPEKSWITNLSIVLDHDGSIVDRNFLHYRLGREPLKEKLNTGAAQAQITIENLSSYQITLPPMRTQRRIVEIVGAYDNLIQNNRRRIQLLEQAARLIYKEWFVRLRFPGHEHAKIIDGVPEGWEKRPLCEIADITMGQSPKSIYYNKNGNGLPFHQGVTNFGVRFPSHETYCTVQNRIAESGDILFSVRAPVGRINITPDKIIIGRGLAAIRSNCDQQNFLFYALKSHFFKEDMMGGGAIFAAITKKDMYGVELVQPTERLVDLFMEHVVPMDFQIANFHKTILKLVQARDILLPKLMNGELAV